MPKKRSLKKAFSLIELSIVLVVIAILVLGTFKGVSLIKSSRILGGRTLTAHSAALHIQGVIAWYEPSLIDSFDQDEASDGSELESWYDIGPSLTSTQSNTLTATASSSVTYREKGINSLPAVEFDGTGAINLAAFYQGSLARNTIFIVFNSALGADSTLLDANDSGDDTSSISVLNSHITINDGTSLEGSTTILAGTTYIVAAYFDETLSRIYLNNSETSDVTQGDAGDNSLAGLTVGGDKTGGDLFSGMISEIIIYNRILKIQERRDIFKYLGNKYNVVVAGL